MTPPRWKFTNPVNADTYEFQVNPTEEEDFGRRRNVERGANTANTGFVLQQSDSGLAPLRVHGTILHKAQLDEMIAWEVLCDEQTIRLSDHEGAEYLGIISEFLTRRQRTVANPRDYANAPFWYWQYDLTFEIVAVISGAWA